jgi:hypothetical protein
MTDTMISPELKGAPKELRSQVQHAAHGVADDLRSTAEQRFDALVHALRSASEELRAVADAGVERAPQLTGMARDVGSTLEHAADRWSDLGMQGAADEVRRFARRRPGSFIALCAVAGFASGRMGRALSATRSEAASSSDGFATADASATRPVPTGPVATAVGPGGAMAATPAAEVLDLDAEVNRG